MKLDIKTVPIKPYTVESIYTHNIERGLVVTVEGFLLSNRKRYSASRVIDDVINIRVYKEDRDYRQSLHEKLLIELHRVMQDGET